MSLRRIARHREASQSTPALTLTFNRVKCRCMQSAILKILHTIEHSKIIRRDTAMEICGRGSWKCHVRGCRVCMGLADDHILKRVHSASPASVVFCLSS